jgi:hypothetical protein
MQLTKRDKRKKERQKKLNFSQEKTVFRRTKELEKGESHRTRNKIPAPPPLNPIHHE